MNYEMLRDIVQARSKSFLLLAFLAVLNVVLYLYLSASQRPELEKVQNEWFSKRQAQASTQSPAVASRYADNERDLALFEKRLIPKKEFASFLVKLFETAKTDKLVIRGMSYQPSPVKGQPAVVTYRLGFTVSGHYAQIKRFIADLMRYPEAVTLDDLSLGNASQTTEAVGLRVQVTVYLKLEGA